ncbi:hypothetical protein [Chitinophaga caseinilytica]|uniref:hypothetical protein n=1 Tax=Chitinophaga caseinilytica TaxID=2267521 RepID=UPI003C2F5855
MTPIQLIEYIKKTFRLEIESQDDNSIIFNYYEYKLELDTNEIARLLSELQDSYYQEETELYNDQYYEVLIFESSRQYIRKDKLNTLTDQVNGLTYSQGEPSNLFVLYTLMKIFTSSNAVPRRVFDVLRYRRLRSMRPYEGQQELFNVPIFEFLKNSLRYLNTIILTSTKSINKTIFENYTYSYIFSLSYNLSYTIYPVKTFDEFLSPLRVESIRRNGVDSIEPPKRSYINDLVLHYQKALSSESLDNQFLSFYHIIEHFFEKIYHEDLQLKVRNELTKPGFSYKKKSDIESIIKVIQNRTKIQREEFQVNELEALELTLKKYIIDIDEIKSELNEIQGNLSDYYKVNEVPFSRGNQVNFDLSPDEIFKALSKRIYYTRNAIVHSKETDKKKYTPFKDDKYLLPEIYLMRLLTERIIIDNSKEI